MHLPRWPRITLLACIVGAVGLPGLAPAQTLRPPVDPSVPEPPQAAGAGGDWVVPPVSLSGLVSYDIRATRAQGETNALSQLVTTRVSASSFIYQPWLATVSGTLGLTLDRSRGGASLTAAGPFDSSQDAPNSKDRFLTGSARVDVFPRSRFPFEAHAERNDSRTDAALASTIDFTTQNIGFSQRYRPPSDAYQVSGGYDRREQISKGVRDIQDQVSGDFSSSWKHNDLSLNFLESLARRQATDERSEFRTLVGRHQYLPDSSLSVNTTVNWSKTDEKLVGSETDQSLLQLLSVGLWQPAGSKLALTGSVRGLVLRDLNANHQLDSVGATVGGTYELNRNVRLTANGNSSVTSSDGVHSQGFSGAAGANWQADTLQLGGFRYDWFASGNVGGSTFSGGGAVSADSLASHDETQRTINAQIGHTLSRSWPIDAQSTLGLHLGQSLNATRTHSSVSLPGDPAESVKTALHTLAGTWNVNAENRSAYARLSYNDSRELGGAHALFQLLNFQVSGNYEFDRNRSISGDMTWQKAVQRTGDRLDTQEPFAIVPGDRSTSRSASGEITYRQQRVFGVPRLRFESRLKLAQDVLKQPGTFASIPDRETRLWENRLDWLVGRLESQLILRLSKIDGKKREFLMWRVQRSFGN
jgi:hypothetical protein